LDDRGRFKELFNNYSRISFNFGPALLTWLERYAQEVYESILEADKVSKRNFSGHGSAIAQVYNHMIMPLASARDKRTQVTWGAEDFESRFGRYPEGMWLPETAVDLDTLESLAESDIKFTILSPHQAISIKKPGQKGFSDVPDGSIDPRRAYFCDLPSGRMINLFFYDRSLSHAIAFGRLLQNGDAFATKLLEGFAPRKDPQIVNVATDGETYGHHHTLGEMALTYCLSNITSGGQARVTNYASFLKISPPKYEVRIVENTSWSCPHGVERWRSNCGCASEIKAGWTQEWRSTLRESMNWLRDRLDEIYQREGSRVFSDPWHARNDFITVLNHSKGKSNPFPSRHLRTGISAEDRSLALQLLEMERCSLLMFASCGWYWEDISRIETIQVMKYAAKGMELAEKLGGKNLRPEYEQRLQVARSNDKDFSDAKAVFEVAAAREYRK
jgi:alpha-amylase/alpha-mannosidase (GH57 family)